MDVGFPDSGFDWRLWALGSAAGAATLAGGVLALRLSHRLHLILGLSAGAVLGVALFDLLPEALELGGGSGRGVATAVGVGFLLYLCLERLVSALNAREGAGRGHLGAASLTAHSLLDGLAIGLGFQVSVSVGTILTLAILAHDLSDGVNTVTTSLEGSADRIIAGRWLLADALAPLAGVTASQFLHPPRYTLALALALFSGVLLYLGAGRLLPESYRRSPAPWTTLTTLVGASLIYAVTRVVP
jgi:ZIP family zinc transporter